MTSVKVHFLGSGDAVASGGRFQACILVSFGERRGLLDCGATSITALKRAGVDPADVDTIFVSHLHDDHFAAPDAFAGPSTEEPLTYWGPPH